jgi:methylphosphotriester-DNA--protein-cysteine methyltransferase
MEIGTKLQRKDNEQFSSTQTGVFCLLFVQAHFDQDNNFDFHRYIRRALDKDFGVMVGIR